MKDNQEKEIDDTRFNSPLGRGVGDKSNMFYGALPIHFELARKLRNNPTDAEVLLWEYLSKINISGIKFRRQHPLLYFIADFYCHKAKLIIEVDGSCHEIPHQHMYDKNRDNELSDLGIKVVRFTNDRVFKDIENVINEIVNEINFCLRIQMESV